MISAEMQAIKGMERYSKDKKNKPEVNKAEFIPG